MTRQAPIAILSALAEEQHGLIALLQDSHCVQRAGREFWCGTLADKPVVLALSRIGKVAAATTATTLIEAFGVGRIVFTGVAGGVGEGVAVGDVVVGSDFVQHDMDASPLFPRYEIPLYGQARFPADVALTALLLQASQAAVAHGPLRTARVHQGLIASGDRFVNGADYAVPFAAVRTISDRADDTAHVDFPQFVKDVASVYARSVINSLMVLL